MNGVVSPECHAQPFTNVQRSIPCPASDTAQGVAWKITLAYRVSNDDDGCGIRKAPVFFEIRTVKWLWRQGYCSSCC